MRQGDGGTARYGGRAGNDDFKHHARATATARRSTVSRIAVYLQFSLRRRDRRDRADPGYTFHNRHLW